MNLDHDSFWDYANYNKDTRLHYFVVCGLFYIEQNLVLVNKEFFFIFQPSLRFMCTRVA